MVEIQYAKLNQEMQENVAGWLYTESNLLPSDDSSGLYPSVRMLITNNAPPNYITFDGDGIDLDNLDKQFYSEGDYVGFISSNITDENCQGSSANDSIYLNYNDGYLNFDNGITISFYGDCCREITVQYIFPDTTSEYETYSVDGDLFYFVPGTWYSNCLHSIKIYFTKSKLPNQFIKVSYVKFGEVVVWNKFKSISLLEEINVLSDDLPINSLDFSVVLKENFEFEDGAPMNVYSNGRYYGTFYLDEAERTSKYIYSIKALNCLSILDNVDFDDWKTELDLCDFIDIVKSKTGITIKEPTNTQYFTFGFVPTNSCRYCLCATAFADGLMIESGRSDSVTLTSIPTEITSIITTSNKRIIGESTFTKSKPITAINLQEVDSFELSESLTFNYEKSGKYYFENSPIMVFEPEDMSNIALFEHSLNYVNFIASQNVSFNAHKLSFYAREYTITNPNITNQKTNEKNIKNFLITGRILVPSEDESYAYYTVARDADVLKYMQSGGTVKAKIVLENEKVGDLIQIETAFDGIKTGIITSMAISFGYRDVAEIEVLEWPIG